MLVAAGQVYFRDLKNFLGYALRMWLYASPILYYAASVPKRYEFLLVLNPIAAAADRVERRDRPRAGAGAAQTWRSAPRWAFSLFVVGALFFISREREFAVRL